MYALDFVLQLKQLLPPRYRSVGIVAWLSAILKPIIQLYHTPSIVHPVRYPVCLPIPVPSFKALMEHANLTASFNGQKIVIERVLNLHFFNLFLSSSTTGASGYWIWIEDTATDFEQIFLFLDGENVPLPAYLLADYAAPPPLPPNGSQTATGPQYIYQISDYYSEFYFIVWIPVWMSNVESEVVAITHKYKLAGKKFQVLTY